jgi:nitrate reductase gamma subunit
MNETLTPFYTFIVTKMPYITITLFILGIALKLRRWLIAPKGPEGPPLNLGAASKYVFLDLVLFRKTWKTDKPTWLLVALFHWSAYGIIFGHLRGFGWWSIQLFEPLGHAFAEFMVETLPVYVGWVFLVTTAILLVRRILYEKSKLQSLPNDYIALVLLLIKGILGQGMRILPVEAYLTEPVSITFIPGLVVLWLEKLPAQDWFYWHVLFTQLFIIYIPFSKMVHIITSVVTSALYGSRRKEYGI